MSSNLAPIGRLVRAGRERLRAADERRTQLVIGIAREGVASAPHSGDDAGVDRRGKSLREAAGSPAARIHLRLEGLARERTVLAQGKLDRPDLIAQVAVDRFRVGNVG